jgi:hypothetical protein
MIRADGLLSLAAAPTFAVMALATALQEAGMLAMLCSPVHGASLLTGMVPMGLAMSAFHSGPWLRLVAEWRGGIRQASLKTIELE